MGIIMNAVEKFRNRVSRYGLKFVMKVILRNKLYRHINQVMISIGKFIFKNCKLSNTIILESHNDFDMNGGAFYNYLLKEGYNKKYKIIWMLRNKKPKKLPENVTGFNMFAPSIRKTYYLCTAKFMTSDHFILDRKREDQIACYLTHGPIGLKAFKDKVIIPDKINCILTPSEYMAPILAEQCGIPYPNEKQKIFGYPMHDVFYDNTPGDLNKISSKKYTKVILWMPTFRKSVDFNRIDSYGDLPLGIPILRDTQSCGELNSFLTDNNALLIIKIHPMQDLTTVKIRGMSNIVVIDGNSVKNLGIDNYRLMKDADAVISDYSSSAYDYLHTNRPLAFTLDDADDYRLGFLFKNPIDYMPGHIIYNKTEFIEFIKDVIEEKDPYKGKRKEILDLFFKYHDGNSSRRLAEFMQL